jgi:hypothetical protein
MIFLQHFNRLRCNAESKLTEGRNGMWNLFNPTTMSPLSKPKGMHESWQKLGRRTANLSTEGRRALSAVRGSLKLEEAMDVAIGAEPWIEEEAA